jgi:hypothetical protein
VGDAAAVGEGVGLGDVVVEVALGIGDGDVAPVPHAAVPSSTRTRAPVTATAHRLRIRLVIFVRDIALLLFMSSCGLPPGERRSSPTDANEVLADLFRHVTLRTFGARLPRSDARRLFRDGHAFTVEA